MGRTDIINDVDIFHGIIKASFEQPRDVQKKIDFEISRNRSLSSKSRRELISLTHQALRWRKRIWGEIAPTQINLDKVRAGLLEAEKLIQNPPYLQWSKLPLEKLATEVSFPSWILDRWIQDQGMESAVQLALAFNEPADTCLRVNTLKSDRDTLAARLKKEDDVDVSPCLLSPIGLKLAKRFNLHAARSFKEGCFEIQDEGSQLCALLSDAKPGQVVIDACARTGGKSLALAALMENKGRIVACDIDARVFTELDRRLDRSGVKIVETKWVAKDDPNPLPALKNKADIVFVDAPCSGLGTLRRKSWLKWTLHSSVLEEMHKLQVQVIKRYSQYVKPGGKLLLVTCSINSLENEKVVQVFSQGTAEFKVLIQKTFRPDLDATDGFFVASFEKALV